MHPQNPRKFREFDIGI